VNTEERQLAEMLHRVAPEPPRRVTVEDVAFRLANEAERARGGPREQRARRGLSLGNLGRGSGWAPALAAAAVVVVAGASTGIATMMTHSHATSSGDGTPLSSAPVSTSATSAAPSQPSTSTGPTFPPETVASGMWGAELIDHQSFGQASLAAGQIEEKGANGAGSLYAISQGFLVRINPVTGQVLSQVSYTSPISDFANRPVVTGNTVWVLSSYDGSSVVLTGYNGKTLAPAGTVTVPVSGQVSSAPQGVLTSGSDGYLYVAAGSAVAVVNPATHVVIRQIPTSGQVSSVAVVPDGSKLYVATGALTLLAYNPVTGAQLGSSSMTGLSSTGGNLVATSGGVWGTVGIGMSEWVWFAQKGDLTRVVRVSQGAGAGLDSVPTFSGGAVWIGGSQKLTCANPATGQVMASTAIPTDNGVLEHFGSVTVAVNGRTYALYQNQAAQQSGVVTLTPPAACSG
jgi:hypothetical protein